MQTQNTRGYDLVSYGTEAKLLFDPYYAGSIVYISRRPRMKLNPFICAFFPPVRCLNE